MRIEERFLYLTTTEDTDVVDITEEVRDFYDQSGMMQGILHVFTPGSTAGVTTLEYESGAIADLKRLFEQLAPRDAEYQHNLRWHDGNGYSHVPLGAAGAVDVDSGGGRRARAGDLAADRGLRFRQQATPPQGGAANRRQSRAVRTGSRRPRALAWARNRFTSRILPRSERAVGRRRASVARSESTSPRDANPRLP